MNVPKLRFKEFSGEWETYKLSEFTIPIKRKNKDNASNLPLTISSLDGLVDQRDYFNRVVASKDMSNYYLLLNGEFAYNKSYSAGFPLGSIKRLDKYEKGALSSLYICFALDEQYIDSDYASYYFDSDKWHKEVSLCVAEGARNHGLLNVSNEEFYETKHLVPCKQEQNRIGDFLQVVYDKINNQKAIVESLENQKKGLMQKIFSQELRFKDDEGKEFPKWEEKKLGEVGEIITGKTPDTNTAEFWNGDIQFITPVDMGNGKYLRTSERTVTEKVKMKILQIGTVMVTCIGATIGKMAIITRKAITNQQINTIYSDTANNEFLYYALLNIVPQIRRMKSNTTMPILNKSEFSALCIKLPCADEQNKIARFLSLMDEKIEKENACLEHWQQIKKGLLKQMFV